MRLRSSRQFTGTKRDAFPSSRERKKIKKKRNERELALACLFHPRVPAEKKKFRNDRTHLSPGNQLKVVEHAGVCCAIGAQGAHFASGLYAAKIDI